MKNTLQQKKDLAIQLSAYAASTGALLALGLAANAQVVYSGEQNLQIGLPLDSIELDLDGDLVTDFKFIMKGYNSGSSGAYGNYSIDIAYGLVLNTRTDSYQNSWIVRESIINSLSSDSSTYLIPAGLNPGEMIDENEEEWAYLSYASWSAALGVKAVLKYGYQSYTSSSNIEEGNFLGKESYLGVRFHIGTDQHYGWIRLSVSEEVDTMTIVDWAYETTPELGIKTGEDDAGNIPLYLQLSGVDRKTNTAAATLSILVNDTITGLELTDFDITNGVASDLVEVDPGLEYTVTVTAAGEGEVICKIPKGVVVDGDDNENIGSILIWEYDLTGPGAHMEAYIEEITRFVTARVEIRFDEKVDGFDLSDLVLTNCTANFLSTQSEGIRYEFDVTAIDEGQVRVVLPAGVVSDEVGNVSDSESSVEWIYDITGPEITITSDVASGSTTAEADVVLNLVISEDVEGFEEADLNYLNATGTLTQISSTEYKLELSAETEGEVGFDISFASFSDLVGNYNYPVQYSWTYSPITGIGDLADEANLLYPNPVQGRLNLELAIESDIQLINFEGKVVYAQNKVLNESIDVNGFSPGVYIVRVKNYETVVFHKIIIE